MKPPTETRAEKRVRLCEARLITAAMRTLNGDAMVLRRDKILDEVHRMAHDLCWARKVLAAERRAARGKK